MLSPAIQDFNQKFAQSSELRQKISQVDSLPQLIELLKQWDCNLSGPDLISLAQGAYQRWLDTLKPNLKAFFIKAHENKALNQAIETCKNTNDAVVLADAHGFKISEIDLQDAATAAHQIEGFSFEKLWFQGIGL